MKRFAIFFLDYVLLMIALLIGYALSPSVGFPVFDSFGHVTRQLWWPLLIVPFLMAGGLRVTNLPFVSRNKTSLEFVIQIALGIGLGQLSFQILRALATAVMPDRYVHLISFGVGFVFIATNRTIIRIITGRYARRVLIVGDQEVYERFCGSQSERGDLRYQVVGYLPIASLGAPSPVLHPAPNLAPSSSAQVALPFRQASGLISAKGQTTAVLDAPPLSPSQRSAASSALPEGCLSLQHHSLLDFCRANRVDDIMVDFSLGISSSLSESLMQCTGQGVNVMETTAFFEKYLQCVHESTVYERWFWGFDPAHQHPFYSAFKRSLDIAVSLCGLCAFAPLAPFVVLAIKLQDRGPVFYSQVRTGLYNRPFRIHKFRTMRVDAERQGAQWAKVGDQRVTWLGSFLRKSRIDEVPQFWNILRGDMSFVGPRPERPEMIEKIEKEIPFYKYRHLIKPGLTGWAQINYPYGASIEDARMKLSYDFYYLKYANPTMDIHIVLRTFVAMAKGAR